MVRIIPSRLSSHLGGSRNNDSKASSRAQSPTRPAATGSPTDKALMLRTRVIKGRNLAAKDRGGTSDPYLVVTLGRSRQSTGAISKTLNPEWNVTFDLPVSGVPLLEAVCWDKDRFGKDYLGEFEIDLAELFPEDKTPQQPLWYHLASKRRSKKSQIVSGDVQLEFSLVDPNNPNATSEELVSQFRAAVQKEESSDDLARFPSNDPDVEEETSDETDDPSKPEVIEKRKKKLRMKRLRRKSMAVRAYEFTGAGKNSVSGLVFMELQKVTDLPPERNMTRTSFDMDPFVVTSLGRKTLRTRVIRHNLNPVFDEKMVFQVAKHEETYTIGFTVMDRDKLSGNDFVASASLPLQTLISAAPEADPETGLYSMAEPDEVSSLPPPSKSRFRIPVSRSTSTTSLSKLTKPGLRSRTSQTSLSSSYQDQPSPPLPAPTSAPSDNSAYLQVYGANNATSQASLSEEQQAEKPEDPDLKSYTVSLILKNKDRWEDKHTPELFLKAKFVPYHALRQQFWRAMLKQYDADDSQRINKIEMTTMLDTLGSTLKPSTINGFFTRFAKENGSSDALTFDQCVICLEDQLQASQKTSLGDRFNNMIQGIPKIQGGDIESASSSGVGTPAVESDSQLGAATVPQISQESLGTPGEDGDFLDADDLGDERSEEHVIEIRECPLCHQPRLDKRSDADIITHIATCASQDWRQVNNLVMGGFVTSSQAQRKWYSKVVTKIGYGGYKLGANSANILVQDRITGQINEEKMSVYVRLGIRLLYKGLKSREMEKKRIRKMLKSLSIKQGKKYDDPASASQIPGFIQFHQLNMDEVLLPIKEFKNFNEFFYRALKPDARPCSAPDNPNIVVSPADCRSVVFDRLDDATTIWVKGREFSVERLLGDAYPEDAKRYKNGALGIFRLAPQDYHRFHVPVDGIMGAPKTIEGEYYTVNPMAIRSALDVYGENVRVVVPIDTELFGRVMFVCIGAMMVGSTVITRKTGEKVSRAEELGYFKFGGSTVLLLFETGAINFDQDILDNANSAVETYIRVGMSIGHHPEHSQHTPDMRKAESEVTNEQRQEAQRAIGGSLGDPKHKSVPMALS